MAPRDKPSSSTSGKQTRKDSKSSPDLPYATATDVALLQKDQWISHEVASRASSSRPYVLPTTQQFFTQRVNTATVNDGSYGTVSRCLAIRTDKSGQTCKPFYAAVKTLRPVTVREQQAGDNVDSKRMKARLQREVGILMHLDHPNIVPVLAYHEDEAAFDQMFVTPWYTSGTLQHWTKRNPTYLQKLDVIEGLASALLYLHRLTRPLIHGDIKPDNIVIEGASKPVIVDFGLCSMLKEGVDLESLDSRPASNRGGNHRWMSDQRIEEKHVSSVDDTYAFGCVTFYVLASKEPFHMAKNEFDFWRIRGQGGLPSSPQYFTPEELSESRFPSSKFWWSIMNHCWSLGPGSPVNSLPSSDVSSLLTESSRSSLDPAWTPMYEIAREVSEKCRNTRMENSLSISTAHNLAPISVALENSSKGTKSPGKRPEVPKLVLPQEQDYSEKVPPRPSSRSSQRSDSKFTGSMRETFHGLKTRASNLFRRSTPSLKSPPLA